MIQVGIESIAFWSSYHYLMMSDLAKARGLQEDYYYRSLGQIAMGIPAPDEDIVTLATHAAEIALLSIPKDSISTVILATESAIDQSKCAGIYVHRLLQLPDSCRVFEIKQACYGLTAALLSAGGMIQLQPEKRILIIGTDIARYGLNTPGEPTHGCGAVAMVISSQPRVAELLLPSVPYVTDVMDFWRPNYRDEALVDGQYSVRIYLESLKICWEKYVQQTGSSLSTFKTFCYHVPFPRMVELAEKNLYRLAKQPVPSLESDVRLVYNQQIGNAYTASLYISFLALLELSPDNLENAQIGMFSYGSGAVAEFFALRILPGYRNALHLDYHQHFLAQRKRISVNEYETFYHHRLPTDGSEYIIPAITPWRYRLKGVKNHQRLYEISSSSLTL